MGDRSLILDQEIQSSAVHLQYSTVDIHLQYSIVQYITEFYSIVHYSTLLIDNSFIHLSTQTGTHFVIKTALII